MSLPTDDLVSPFTLEYTYKRSTGPVIGRFLAGLRDGQLLGVRTLAGDVLVPPTEYEPTTGAAVTFPAPGRLVAPLPKIAAPQGALDGAGQGLVRRWLVLQKQFLEVAPGMKDTMQRMYAAEPELGIACMQAWNDWYHEEWVSAAPDRLVPVGCSRSSAWRRSARAASRHSVTTKRLSQAARALSKPACTARLLRIWPRSSASVRKPCAAGCSEGRSCALVRS